jgi:hypothetical protein
VAFAMLSIEGIQFLQCRQQASDIVRMARMNNIQIEGGHRCPVQGGANTSDENEIDRMSQQGLELKDIVRHRSCHGVT